MRAIPLRIKLPLLIAILLCIVVTALGWLGHREVERVLLDATGARLSAVTQRLVSALEVQAARLPVDMQKFARDTSLARVLTRPDAGSRARAQQILDSVQAAQVLATELSDRNRRSVLYVGTRFKFRTGDAAATERVSIRAQIDTGLVSELVSTDSGVIYLVTVPVVTTLGDTAGYFTEYRTVGTRQSAELINDLIGPGTTLLFGNTRGNLWADMNVAVPGPNTPLVPDTLLEYTPAGGSPELGVAHRIRGTPWVALVQVPRGDALGPATRFLYGMGGAAFIVVSLGCAAGLFYTRQITGPLTDVTEAASDFARGDYGRRVKKTREDEIGAVAGAFNKMAEQVESSSVALVHNAQALRTANADLQESEKRYRRLVERLPDAILVHRGDRVVYANAAAVDLFGAPSADMLLEHSLEALVPESSNGGSRKPEFAPQLQGTATLHQRRANRLNGSLINAETFDVEFDDDATAKMMILRDVSERDRLEERFRQAQKMEAVGQLAGGVAHDFNNLLTVITAYSAIILSDLQEGSQIRTDMQEIANAADRAAVLTRQLLAFSRQQVLEPQVVSFNTIIAEMERMLRRVIPESIKLETRLDFGIGNICADPGQMEQVLMNLAVNARDAMPEGGNLTLETSTIEIGELDGPLHSGAVPGTYVLLSVSDTGCGMTLEQQARIFDPFYTTKPMGKGTGLGLSTVYGIVKQSGGYIWVYSEPGQGSVFRIYLPRVDAPAQSTARSEGTTAPSRGNETVLLVEDELIVRTAARRILEAAGYHVLEVASGREALDVCVRHRGPIDLLLTDMVMPEMSGRELSEKFRQLCPTAPTVFMSGYTEETVQRQNASDPELVFVQKPFTPQSLTMRVRKALEAA